MINIDSTLFYQMIGFLILLFLLNFILYRPLISKIKERFAIIDQLNKEAKELQEKAKQNQHHYLSKIKETEQVAKQNYSLKIADVLKEKEERISQETKKAHEEIIEFEQELNKSIENELASSKNYSVEIASKVYEQLLG